jgi:hypothetical protein
MKKLLPCLLILLIFTNCRKIQEQKILNGDWEFISAYVNHDITVDILDMVLPYHSTNPSDCYYQILFEEDGIAYGRYYTYDTLNYKVEGVWELKKYNVFQVKLDRYVNGTFIVKNMGDGDIRLISDEDSNIVEALGNAKVYTEMNFHREKRED